MALIKCPECGKEFSSFASACPNCGCPIDIALKGNKGLTKEFSLTINNQTTSFSFSEKSKELLIKYSNKTNCKIKLARNIRFNDIDVQSKVYKKSGFAKAFKTGAIAAAFGMGLIFDPAAFNDEEVEVVGSITVFLLADDKQYKVPLIHEPFAVSKNSNDQSFNKLVDLLNLFKSFLKEVNDILYASYRQERSSIPEKQHSSNGKFNVFFYTEKSFSTTPSLEQVRKCSQFVLNPSSEELSQLVKKHIKAEEFFILMNHESGCVLMYEDEELSFNEPKKNGDYIVYLYCDEATPKIVNKYFDEMLKTGTIRLNDFDEEDETDGLPFIKPTADHITELRKKI